MLDSDQRYCLHMSMLYSDIFSGHVLEYDFFGDEYGNLAASMDELFQSMDKRGYLNNEAEKSRVFRHLSSGVLRTFRHYYGPSAYVYPAYYPGHREFDFNSHGYISIEDNPHYHNLQILTPERFAVVLQDQSGQYNFDGKLVSDFIIESFRDHYTQHGIYTEDIYDAYLKEDSSNLCESEYHDLIGHVSEFIYHDDYDIRDAKDRHDFIDHLRAFSHYAKNKPKHRIFDVIDAKSREIIARHDYNTMYQAYSGMINYGTDVYSSSFVPDPISMFNYSVRDSYDSIKHKCVTTLLGDTYDNKDRQLYDLSFDNGVLEQDVYKLLSVGRYVDDIVMTDTAMNELNIEL